MYSTVTGETTDARVVSHSALLQLELEFTPLGPGFVLTASPESDEHCVSFPFSLDPLRMLFVPLVSQKS